MQCSAYLTVLLYFDVLIDMAKLVCRNYGFECDFVVGDTDLSKVLEEFGKHTSEEHGIEYSKESLMQFILRQGGG